MASLPPISADVAAESWSSMQVGCYIAYATAMIVLLIRIYARAFVVRAIGLDDVFVIVGALGSTAILITVPIQFNLGIGKHVQTLTAHELLYGRQAAWISQIFYYFSLGFTKCSIVALYYRLASERLHKKILLALGFIIVLHGLIASIVTSHMCSPVSIIWGPTFPVGCIDLLNFNYFNAAFHIFTDILLAVLPIPVLIKLQLDRKRKISLAVAFAAGIVTIAATIARQVYNNIALTNYDFSWNWAPTELVTNIEINMGVICASVPAIQAWIKSTFGTPTSSQSYPQSHSKKSSTGFSKHSQGRSTEASVKESSVTNIVRLGSEDGMINQSTENDTNDSGKVAASGGEDSRFKTETTVTKGPKQTIKELIQLREMTGTRNGVVKSVDYRVEYS